MAYVCAIDTGGTFTDCVLLGEDGDVVQAKAPSTPDDFARGVFEAMAAAAGARGLRLEDLLANVGHLLVGTTVGTNTMVQRDGARLGMVVTRGHADAVRIMRGHGRVAGRPLSEALAPFLTAKPEPLVPRSRTVEIDERIDCFGDVVVPAAADRVREAVEALAGEQVDAVAVCFLWSFVNPTHERLVQDIVHGVLPDALVSASSDVAPRWGEYERWSATLLNAYLAPATSRYVDGLRSRLSSAGYTGRTLLMTSSGGALPADEAKRLPLLLLGSGPVGGIAGSVRLARALEQPNVIATDMGGTSFDVGLIHDYEPVRSTQGTVAGYEYYAPQVEVRSIGSGGGSIALVDETTGTLHVGPMSAGATPGPACYGRGGTAATVTDANLVLGLLNPDFFLGGAMTLDVAAARHAVEQVARAIGLGLLETASGIVRITEAHMADLLRRMTVEKGLNPRDFALHAYGGAGGLHASAFARELGVRSVVVPLADAASVWSAFGIASSDILHVLTATEIMAAPFDGAAINEHLERLETEAHERLRRDGVDAADVDLRRTASLRYTLQVHELPVPLPPGRLGDGDLTAAVKAFERLYEQRYGEGAGYAEAGFELVMVTVEATGRLRKPPLAERRGAPEGASSTRPVHWPELGERLDTPVLRADALSSRAVTGPAVVEMPSTTVAVRPGDRCRLDHLGNLVLELA